MTARDHISDPCQGATALVTGGCGFLGHHLVRRLVSDGWQVTVLDDFSTGTWTNLPNSPQVSLVEGSVLDPVACRRAAEGVSLVFHLAAVVGMRLAVSEREQAYRISEDGTRNVLEASGDARAVLFSSSAIYGLTRKAAVSEDQVPGEEGCLQYDGGYRGYASGKWALEQLGRAEAAAGRSILIVRPFNAVGERQSGTYGMVVPSFIQNALSGRALSVFDDGNQSRTFSEVRTVVNCLVNLLPVQEAWQVPHNVINIGTQQSTTIRELAQIVLAETGADVPLRFIPYGEAFPGKTDVRARIPDTKRLESRIGAVEWPPLRQIVRDLVAQARVSATNERTA